MIRDASESAKYRASLIGLMLIGFGLVDPNVSIVPISFGLVVVALGSAEKYLEYIIDDAKNNNYHIGLKLVRGAYHRQEIERSFMLDYDCPVHREKSKTDQDFNTAQKICVENINLISFCSATHNEESTEYLVNLLNNHNIRIDDERIIFSQLLGMSDNISYNLSHMGYYVAKYVPYGPVKDVIPYLIRRAEENTSIAGQMNNELVNLIKERRRRRS